MTTAQTVANYFLYKDNLEDESAGISNLKLQKLVYYAQGFHLAVFDKPLFKERVSAWAHGPVVPDLYHEYKEYGSNPIPFDEDFDPTDYFDDGQLELLEEVFNVFGQFTAWKLRDMTHEEKPWLAHEETGTRIPRKELKAYFKTRIN